jgi:ketosteroid isomerase-like protein
MVRLAALGSALAICLGALLGGCGGGGGDKKEAEQTVRDFVKAVNERDADTYCDDLITKEFREKTSFATGDEARDSCKRDLKANKGLHVDLVRIASIKVDGDRATVTAVMKDTDTEGRREIQLEKEDGDWRIAGAG